MNEGRIFIEPPRTWGGGWGGGGKNAKQNA